MMSCNHLRLMMHSMRTWKSKPSISSERPLTGGHSLRKSTSSSFQFIMAAACINSVKAVHFTVYYPHHWLFVSLIVVLTLLCSIYLYTCCYIVFRAQTITLCAVMNRYWLNLLTKKGAPILLFWLKKNAVNSNVTLLVAPNFQDKWNAP